MSDKETEQCHFCGCVITNPETYGGHHSAQCFDNGHNHRPAPAAKSVEAEPCRFGLKKEGKLICRRVTGSNFGKYYGEKCSVECEFQTPAAKSGCEAVKKAEAYLAEPIKYFHTQPSDGIITALIAKISEQGEELADALHAVENLAKGFDERGQQLSALQAESKVWEAACNAKDARLASPENGGK